MTIRRTTTHVLNNFAELLPVIGQFFNLVFAKIYIADASCESGQQISLLHRGLPCSEE